MRVQIPALACASLLVAGCTALPTVKYKQIRSPADMQGVSDTYFLQRSQIGIALTESAEKGKEGKPDTTTISVTVTSTPAEHVEFKLGFTPVRNWRSKTGVNLVKHENTDLPKTVGVEVSNEVVKTITEVGTTIVKVIAGVAAVAGAAEGGPKPCIDSRKQPLLVEPSSDGLGDKGGRQIVEGNAGDKAAGCIAIRYDPLPPDAIPIASMPVSEDVNAFYYAACRRATVTVTHRGEAYVGSIRISDPRYLQAAQMPPKGSLTMHSQCGVSVTSEKAANETTASAIVEALSTQAKAIKDAIEAAKK